MPYTAESPTFLHILKAAPESITQARHLVRAICLEQRMSDEKVAAAELATSELVTNAYNAAHGPDDVIDLRVRLAAGRVSVQVWDRTDEKPEEKITDPRAEKGRGLMIVSALADTWGVFFEEGRRGGKWVWAVL